MEYLDFEIEIAEGMGREYPVSVLRSPAGEARARMRFPFDELELESRLKDLEIALLRSGTRRRAVSRKEQAVRDFGMALFDALLDGEVRTRYDVSRQQAAQDGKGLRVKLRILAPELARLPWEFIYDERDAEYLVLARRSPVVRYLELPQPIQPLHVAPPLRVLGMIASPSDLPELDVVTERERVERALEGLRQSGLLELHWIEGGSWRELQREMRGGPWHVFHFIGHGLFDSEADEGLIALANDEGRTHRLSATQLGRLLANHAFVRLVLLNACEGAKGGKEDVFSSTASILVRRGIPAVVAMQYEITDRAAIEFSRVFYESVADGFAVDPAVTEARTAVSTALGNSVEWGTPVLYMRAPDGVLFEIEPGAAASEAKDTTGGEPPRGLAEAAVAGEPLPEPSAVVAGERPGGRARRRRLLAAGWLGVPALGALALGLVPASRADVEMDLRVSQLGFTLDQRQALFPRILNLESLGASGFESLRFMHSTASDLPTGPAAAFRLLAEESGLDRGSTSLDVGQLPAGTEVVVGVEDGGQRLSFTLPDESASWSARASFLGPVWIIVPPRFNELREFETPGSVEIAAGSVPLTLSLTHAAGEDVPFLPNLSVNGVDLVREEVIEEEAGAGRRWLSTVRGGEVSFPSLGTSGPTLSANEILIAEGSEGRLQALELVDGELSVRFIGSVSDLEIGPRESRRSVMPSRLASLTLPRIWPVVVLVAIYLGTGAFFLYRRSPSGAI